MLRFFGSVPLRLSKRCFLAQIDRSFASSAQALDSPQNSRKTSTRIWRSDLLKETRPLKPKSITQLWDDLKTKYPDCLLMIQIGDFYEMLKEDAKLASEVLDITLTKRRYRRRFSKKIEEEYSVDMAGIPVRSLQRHLPKLTRAGIKAVVVQQEPQTKAAKEDFLKKNAFDWTNKGLHREVTRVVTAGTLYEDELLDPTSNNFLVCIVASSWSDPERQTIGLAWGDISTGDLLVRSLSLNELKEHLQRINPTEVLLSEDVDRCRPPLLDWLFDEASMGAKPTMITFVDNAMLKDVQLDSTQQLSLSALERRAMSGLRRYVDSTLKPNFEWALPRLANMQVLSMDNGTRSALEVIKSQSATGGKSSSLLGQIDFTSSPLGARLLRSRLESPSTDLDEINHRLDAVGYFLKKQDEGSQVSKLLRSMRDPARAFQRIRVGRGTLKDLVDVFHALDLARVIADEVLIPDESMGKELKESIKALALQELAHPPLLTEGTALVKRALDAPLTYLDNRMSGAEALNVQSRVMKSLESPVELHNELSRALFPPKHYAAVNTESQDEEPEDADRANEAVEDSAEESELELDESSSNVGRVFKQGFSPLYDTLYDETTGANSKRISELEAKYQLQYEPKIRLVRMGPKTNASSAASATGKRAGNTLFAIEVPKAVKLDPSVFTPLQTLKYRTRYTTADLNEINAASFASRDTLAQVERIITDYLVGHCLSMSNELQVVFSSLARVDVACSSAQAAHERNLVRPLVSKDAQLAVSGCRHLVVERYNANFVPNDVQLESKGHPSTLLITGPNMGGKSTFLRSCAAVVILAQAGCFVPAKNASIGLVDRIFARIGASDDIAHNRSTFMVEMEETAGFLTQATKDSLVIVDELGRGTSPEEGLAIAQACLEELVSIGSKCLFATHFHALASMDSTSPASLFPKEIRRLTTEVIDAGKRVVFTYKMHEGVAESSHGLNVARMAGVPQRVIDRAEALLEMKLSNR